MAYLLGYRLGIPLDGKGFPGSGMPPPHKLAVGTSQKEGDTEAGALPEQLWSSLILTLGLASYSSLLA